LQGGAGCEGLEQVLGAWLPGSKEKDLKRARDLQTPCHFVMSWRAGRELWSGKWQLAHSRDDWEEQLEFAVPVQSRALGRVRVSTRPPAANSTFGEDRVFLVTSVVGTDACSDEVFSRRDGQEPVESLEPGAGAAPCSSLWRSCRASPL
jgi:hypothetical protein